jgi:hypothetical protein
MLLVTYVDDWLSNMIARDFFEDILVENKWLQRGISECGKFTHVKQRE